MSIKIFVITHKPFTPPSDPMYIPLHVGRANSSDLGFLGDDTGDSISALNPSFCELTGMYWLWKNYHAADFIGICHYRRYLINEASSVKTSSIFTEPQLEKLLSDYDIITTKLLTLTCSYYDGFQENHHIKDLDTTAQVLKEKYPAMPIRLKLWYMARILILEIFLSLPRKTMTAIAPGCLIFCLKCRNARI